jgi:RNA polymerase sigma-70 factor (ECF subfamily)
MADDVALLRRIRDGDRRAFRDLTEHLAPAALAVATRVTANRDIAEEAVQEAFVDVWRQCERYDARRGGLRQWVLGVVHHKAVDAVRRERAVGAASKKGPDLVSPPDPEEAGVASDRRTRVRRAVEQLPPAQREAIMLAYFGGLTYREVSKQLSIPEGTAKSRLRDGLMNLRGLLERQGLAFGDGSRE